MRRCVDRVYADGSDADLADRFRANVSRFAAYKADYVKTTVSNILNDASIPLKQRQEMADAAVAGFDRYSDAECNTATSRCRTAKQWKEFNDPQRLRLFPNLRWLPSRSAVIRATHEKFYDKVWPKGDDFWNTNMPGQEWNCKCDLEETDDPVTDNSDVKTVPVPKGLEGNPSVTGEIFTDKASYISKARKEAVKETVSKCFYKDSDSDMRISVMADRMELTDNIHTGRILAKTENVTIRPHFKQEPGKPIKNPEYEINGEIADAKRILSPTGITAGFQSAKEQGVSVVVIDYGDGKWRIMENGTKERIYYNAKKTAKAISNRFADFENELIKKCFVVYNGKYIEVGQDIFKDFPGNSKVNRIKRIDWIMKKISLLKTQ